MIRVLLSRIRDPQLGEAFGYCLLRGLALVNERLVREGAVPRLYESGVRYVLDPPGQDTFADALHVWRAKQADCSSLVAWRVGELWASGERGADFRLRHYQLGPGEWLYHIYLVRANGKIEDPSRMLGM